MQGFESLPMEPVRLIQAKPTLVHVQKLVPVLRSPTEVGLFRPTASKAAFAAYLNTVVGSPQGDLVAQSA